MFDPPKELVFGLDIGQKRDPTAIAVAELERREVNARTEVHFTVRHLERLPLGTPYPAVAKRFAEVVYGAHDKIKDEWHWLSVATLYVDATGVGQPVIDLLREHITDWRVSEVYFTYGDRRNEAFEGAIQRVSLGKAYLVSRLQALLQTGRLQIPKNHREADALVQELLDYEIRVDENANDRYGAFRVGTHDDLVTALGLAVQADRPLRYYAGVW